MGMHQSTINRIEDVKNYLEKHGPIKAPNVDVVARQMGVKSNHLVRVFEIVRSDWWITDRGWTIPFVAKGIGTKTYSVEKTVGQTQRLRNGNQRKSNEVETHLRRNLAGLKLEARLATGEDQRKARILATTTKAALDLIDLGV